jgi:hypothetical protein
MSVRSIVLLAVLATLVERPATAVTPPWQRTESREPCGSYAPFRQPFFGDIHIHTHFSADAYIFGTRVSPRDAYDFARGATIPVADEHEQLTRSATIDRPLDFAAVTDHSEWYGEVNLCSTPGSIPYDDSLCQMLRQAEPTPDDEFAATVLWLYLAGIPNPPRYLSFCSLPGVDCAAQDVSVWQEIQAAAEEAYDRSGTCGFTSFIGYESTPSPLGRHLHRNVIFRNEHVPARPASFLDTYKGGTPQGLWTAIETDCLGAGTGCDAVIIPHNPNLSGGMQFMDPADADEALRRQTLEPLVEIHQIKGNSECRFDRLAGAGVGTTDELCTFEQDPHPHQGPDATDVPIDQYPRRNLVRPTLEDGLSFEEKLGVNPFRFGFVGSTDTHDGTAGNTSEVNWPGGQGANDGSPALQISEQIRTNPGGLAVVWAEENSRDAIFSALARRETYATSGTRPIVRFFAGDLSDVTCGDAAFVEHAYASGTPMGGELGDVRGKKSPRFAVWAMKDPAGVDLERVQIVKGSVDASGAIHEQVIDVAGNASNGASVDPATCNPTGTGDAELCTVWEDPSFDPAERAFYYARVIENPVCRWSTHVCKAAGVDPLSSDCATQAAAAPAEFADCCLGTANDAFLDPLVRERAWTSPVWYRPEAIARLRARLRFGARTGKDALALRATLGSLPPTLDLDASGLTLRVADDDDVLVVAVPPKGFHRRGRHRFVFKDRAHGVRVLSVVMRRGQTLVTLAAGPTDLSHAAREDHLVTVALAAGTFRASYTRTWVLKHGALVPAGR